MPKLLTDELAELLNPAPRAEADPEAADAGHDAAAFQRRRPSAGGGDGGGGAVAPLDMGGRLRLRAPVELDGGKYAAGKRVTSREAFGGGLSSDDDDEEEEEEEEDDDEDDAAAAAAAKARRGAARAPAAKRPRLGDDDDDDEEDDDEDGDDEDEETEDADDDDAAEGNDGNDDDATAHLEREYARAEAEGARVMAASGGDRARREAAKGRAVRAQLKAWEAGLERRILLQKAVAGANRLPRPAARRALRAAAAADAAGETESDLLLPRVERAFAELRREGAATLAALLELHAAFVAQHPAARAAAAAEAGGSGNADDNPSAEALERGGAEACWDATRRASDSVAPFRDAALDKWHRRTVGGGGGGGAGGGGASSGRGGGSSSLRLLGQDVSAQVQAVMRDGERAARRAQLPRLLAPRPLCAGADPGWREPRAAAAAVAGGGGDGVDNDDEANEEEDARDPETFDDGEFYSQLLRELLDGAAGGGAAAARAAGAAAAAAAAAAKKRRRLVDRRASKGRRIRYHVHEKLVGFMPRAAGGGGEEDEDDGAAAAAVGGAAARLPFAEQLFRNLFGGPAAAPPEVEVGAVAANGTVAA
jgi:protein AATF/BFR2